MADHYYILEHLEITTTTLSFTSVLKFKDLSHALLKLQESRVRHVLFRNISILRAGFLKRLSVSLKHLPGVHFHVLLHVIVQHHTSQTPSIILREKFQGWSQGGAIRGYDTFHGCTLAGALLVKSNIKQDVPTHTTENAACCQTYRINVNKHCQALPINLRTSIYLRNPEILFKCP